MEIPDRWTYNMVTREIGSGDPDGHLAAAGAGIPPPAGPHPALGDQEQEGRTIHIMTNLNIRTAAFLLGAACLAFAQGPPVNVSPARHPHLAAAQKQCLVAWNKTTEAQKANDWDMQGNGQRAKDALVKVGELIKQAAESANKNAYKPKAGAGPIGQEPVVDISAARHPHLAAAQEEVRKAWKLMLEAQLANDWDMDGHAQKAKELLAQASKDLKAAAEAANANAPAKGAKH